MTNNTFVQSDKVWFTELLNPKHVLMMCILDIGGGQSWVGEAADRPSVPVLFPSNV